MQSAQRDGLFAPARRALTIGLVLTVTLVAFEALAVVTILPVIKDDLGGLRLYGWVTSAFFLGTLVGIVVTGGMVGGGSTAGGSVTGGSTGGAGGAGGDGGTNATAAPSILRIR
jgi:hypothetical protein